MRMDGGGKSIVTEQVCVCVQQHFLPVLNTKSGRAMADSTKYKRTDGQKNVECGFWKRTRTPQQSGRGTCLGRLHNVGLVNRLLGGFMAGRSRGINQRKTHGLPDR